MTTVVEHTPSAVALGDAWGARCSCGWRGKTYEPKEAVALKIAEQHAVLKAKAEVAKGCGKARFGSREAADKAILDAKIANGLRGNTKRREARAYRCPTCPDRPWHLTSRT